MAQCYWYRGWGAKQRSSRPPADGTEIDSDASKPPSEHGTPSERSPLLSSNGSSLRVHDLDERNRRASFGSYQDRSQSLSTIHEHLPTHNVSHLSPTVPLHAPRDPLVANIVDGDYQVEEGRASEHRSQRQGMIKSVLFNAAAVLVVCAAGVLGWWLSWRNQPEPDPHDRAGDDEVYFNVQGQIYGYICAVLYLASRIPQLWQNYQRQKTEGLSILFFLFACIGNLSYVLSIVAYDPTALCKHHECREGESLAIYGKYMLVNLSWLLGSFGTLLLDLGVFVQFFIYRDNNDEYVENEQRGMGHETQSDYTDDTVVADVYRIQGRRLRRDQNGGDHQDDIH